MLGLRALELFGCLLVVLALTTSCVWHTPRRVVMINPLGILSTAEGNGNVSRIQSFPLLLEGGQQWGVTVGYASILQATPESVASGTIECLLCESPCNRPEIQRLSRRFVAGQFTDTAESDAVYHSRHVLGLSAVVGSKATALRFGFSRQTLFIPACDAVHLLHHDSRDPMGTRFYQERVEGDATP